jgi:hypothetical protein
MNTHETTEEFLDASFCIRPMSYQGKYRIISSQNLFLVYECKNWCLARKQEHNNGICEQSTEKIFEYEEQRWNDRSAAQILYP